MPAAGGGFAQCYNAQPTVAADSLLVIAADVTQAPNDKQQLLQMLDRIAGLPEGLREVGELPAGNGYFSESNVNACAAAGIDPMIAMGHQAHHLSLEGRFADSPPPSQGRTPLEAMAHRLETPAGRKLHALRKQTPEPVFGIIKSVPGSPRCLLPGLDNVCGEWNLGTMAWNMKRMFVLAGAR